MDNERGLRFLIDYENVREAGLDGTEYLCNTDGLAIFYSQACEKISRRAMDLILKSGCLFQTYRLQKVSKNALDFYITSRTGELLGAGYSGKIIIVSRDKGYQAVRDYWEKNGRAGRVLLKASVREGIAASGESSARRKQIAAESEQVSIAGEYEKYQERKRIVSRMEELFRGTEYEDAVMKICELTEEKKNPKELYLGSLRKFGRTDGTKIYRYLKRAADI
ncbi:MAG: PIN domain-containing protein [Lachnospiraceae bacterium]|nr:PIN domain-containing protein [Lachnospiraceae bacterium]